jgi:hypothetical protein
LGSLVLRLLPLETNSFDWEWADCPAAELAALVEPWVFQARFDETSQSMNIRQG